MGQRIIFPEKGIVDLEQCAPAPVGRGDLFVKTETSLISIGTEMAILHKKYDADTHFAEMFSFPQLQTGNQSVGIVEEAGADIDHIKPGDRVFMRKAHASDWTLPAKECSPIPPGINNENAIWCGLAKIAFRAAQAAPFQLGGDTLIIGAGPIGQMAARWAAAAGMGRIVVSDLSRHRLSKLPARVKCVSGSVVDQTDTLMALSDGRGFRTIVDSTGNAAVFQTALGLAAAFGKVILLGDTGYPSKQCLSSHMMMRGVSVVATHDQLDRSGWTQNAIDRLFFDLAATGSFNTDDLITHRFAPGDFKRAYDLVSNNSGDAIGVVFDWAPS